MATILEFKHSQPARASRPGTSARAEVIFFPGIRYEYHDPDAEAAPSRKRQHKHERLELPEL